MLKWMTFEQAIQLPYKYTPSDKTRVL
jgi:hypothetical protein